MATRQNTLSLEDLRRLVEAEQIDTVMAAFPDLYGRLLGKRFEAGYFLEHVADHGTHACNYLLTVDMEMEPVPGYEYANWDKGYGDFHLAPDLGTLRKADWLEKTALVLCDVQDDASDALVPFAPRSVLKQQIARTDFDVMAGSELEYYIFGDSYRSATERGFHGLRPAGQYLEDYHLLQGTREETLNAAARRHLTKSGVPVECTKGEWGPGQHELNLRYAPVLEMADRHALYKHALKEIADSREISVTFMAKYCRDRAGSSCHVHVSLWENGKNAFVGQQRLGAVSCSDAFRWFLGGWIAHASEMMVFYAPTVNSYKRFRSGSWAPTRLAWAIDNRTTGFRVVGHDQSLRIECRIPGADCNPYLVYAAAVASGLDGIANQLEPPPMFEGNAYAADAELEVPNSLQRATELFADSRFAHETFGSDVVAHYSHFFRTEQRAFDQAVTDWERKRYFERI